MLIYYKCGLILWPHSFCVSDFLETELLASHYPLLSIHMASAMSMSLPYVNGASRGSKYPNRTITDWGSPLPTRKLSPHDDVHFDPALKPRAHHMVGK